MLHLDAIPGKVRSLLELLAPASALAPFALGGGTSLALRFGHRISVDLDWFTTDEFHPDDLAGDLGRFRPHLGPLSATFIPFFFVLVAKMFRKRPPVPDPAPAAIPQAG